MAERLKAHAWKACVPRATVGSNPTLSAIQSASAENPRPERYAMGRCILALYQSDNVTRVDLEGRLQRETALRDIADEPVDRLAAVLHLAADLAGETFLFSALYVFSGHPIRFGRADQGLYR